MDGREPPTTTVFEAVGARRSTHALAQLNVARAVAPLDDPRMAGFMARLEEINRLGDSSPGFVWRLQDASGDATGFRVGEDPRVVVNLTVWESPEALHAFTYRSEHRAVFARRRDWFEPWEGPSLVLWWQPVGAIPELADAFRRLELLAEHGPTAEAFTFKTVFPAPDRQPEDA